MLKIPALNGGGPSPDHTSSKQLRKIWEFFLSVDFFPPSVSDVCANIRRFMVSELDLLCCALSTPLANLVLKSSCFDAFEFVVPFLCLVSVPSFVGLFLC